MVANTPMDTDKIKILGAKVMANSISLQFDVILDCPELCSLAVTPLDVSMKVSHGGKCGDILGRNTHGIWLFNNNASYRDDSLVIERVLISHIFHIFEKCLKSSTFLS